MLVIFLFDFDCGSKCLPTPFPALAFCLTITNTWVPRPYKQQGEQNRSGFKARSCLALPLLLVAPQSLCVRVVQSGWTDTYCASLLTIWHLWQAAATFFINFPSGYKTIEGENTNTDEQKLKACITCAGLCTSNKTTKFRGHLKSYCRLFLNSAEVLRAPEDKWEGSRSERTSLLQQKHVFALTQILPFCKRCGDRYATTRSRGGLKQPY